MDMILSGTTYNPGDVILAAMPFVDAAAYKFRPVVVLFELRGNIVVASITSNPSMVGIPVDKRDGLLKSSVIKFNSIFTITPSYAKRRISSLSNVKKKLLFETLVYHMQPLAG